MYTYLYIYKGTVFIFWGWFNGLKQPRKQIVGLEDGEAASAASSRNPPSKLDWIGLHKSRGNL